MKTTKRLLALCLSVLMLCGFGVAAGAEMTEEMTPEELEAYGRALLMQTMEIFRGDYTFEGFFEYSSRSDDPHNLRKDYEKVIHSNGNYAFFFRRGNTSTGEYDLLLENDLLHVYPERKAYQRIATAECYNYLPLLEPRVVTEDTPISVSKKSLPFCDQIEVLIDGYCYHYRLYNGENEYYLSGIESDATFCYISSYVEKGADQSYFDISRMRRVSDFSIWWWGFTEDMLYRIWDIVSFFQTVAHSLLEMLPWLLLWPINIFIRK